jgi:hypothetical protein
MGWQCACIRSIYLWRLWGSFDLFGTTRWLSGMERRAHGVLVNARASGVYMGELQNEDIYLPAH